MKKLFLLLALTLISSVAVAGPIGLAINPPAGGEDAFILAPIGALEFNPTTKADYGLAISESLAFARLFPADDKHVVISPYAFVGVFAAANIGKWVDTNGNAPLSVDYGFMVGLPKLDMTIPEVAFSLKWNSINRGAAQIMVNAAFPSDILSDILVSKL